MNSIIILLDSILIVLLLILIINLLTFHRLEHGHRQGDTPLRAPASPHTPSHIPMVSVLIPARDEEASIEQCVRSLVAQTYEPLEVLVLDDNSSDATPALVQVLIDQLPKGKEARLRLLQGAPLPAGWVGKNFACYQLAQHAKGEYLFFTDADTVHAPNTVAAVIEYMQQLDVQLLTAQPEHILGSLGEMLVVPLLNFTILTLLPIALISRRPEPSLATGNGQLLCFQHQAYQSIGGHQRVKNRILEDVLLARATKAAGYHMTFVDALEMVHCRMYRSFVEVWAGFSKNLFAFYSYSLPFALLGLLLHLSLFVLPAFLLLFAPFLHLSPTVVALAASAYLLPVLMRLVLTLRFVRSQRPFLLLLCLFHPLSILLECLILLNSIRWHYRKGGTSWKGRTY